MWQRWPVGASFELAGRDAEMGSRSKRDNIQLRNYCLWRRASVARSPTALGEHVASTSLALEQVNSAVPAQLWDHNVQLGDTQAPAIMLYADTQIGSHLYNLQRLPRRHRAAHGMWDLAVQGMTLQFISLRTDFPSKWDRCGRKAWKASAAILLQPARAIINE